jgi:hypothetical protein
MTKLKHWLRWIWGWLSHPRKSWRYWLQSRRLVLVGANVQVWSISVDKEEQLAGSLPGVVFSEVSRGIRLRARVGAGGGVSLGIENLSDQRLPFLGLFDMQSVVLPGHREMLPIPQTILEPHERRTIRLSVINGGIIEGLMIPSSAPRLEKGLSQ